MVDGNERSVSLAFSSEVPVVRWWGIEILSHGKKSMRTTRTKGENGLPLLFNHDRDALIGRLKGVTIGEDMVARGVASFDEAALGEEKFQQVLRGTLTDVSVGFLVHFVEEWKAEELPEDLLKLSAREKLPVYRITDWEPFEVSMVTVPADPTVGVGRTADAVSGIPGSGNRQDLHHQEEIPMPEKTTEEVAQEEIRERQKLEQASAERERARMKVIHDLSGRWQLPRRLVEKAEKEGTSIEQFRGIVLDWVSARNSSEPLETPAGEIGLTRKEAERFSIIRAIKASMHKDWTLAPFEKECSDTVAKQTGGEPRSFFIPYDVMTLKRSHRDLVVGTDSAGGYLVGTQHMAGSFIELLRARLVAARAGVQVMPGLVGNLDIPKQTGAATAYWIATEGTAPTEGALTFGQVVLSPKNVGAYVDITRNLIKQSSPAADNIVINDLTKQLALAIDLAVLHGSGASGQPTGLENVSGIGSFTAASITRALALNAIEDVENANADEMGMKWITNPSGKAVLRGREQASGYPVYLCGDDLKMLGFDLLTTTQVSSGYLFFGDWTNIILGEWGVLDINVDDKSLSTSGGIRIVAFESVDVACRQPGAFSLGTSLS